MSLREMKADNFNNKIIRSMHNFIIIEYSYLYRSEYVH